MGPYDLREVVIGDETMHIRPIRWSDDRFDEDTEVLVYESVCPLVGEKIEIESSDIVLGEDGLEYVYQATDMSSSEKISYVSELNDERDVSPIANVRLDPDKTPPNMIEQAKDHHESNCPFQDPVKSGELKQS